MPNRRAASVTWWPCLVTRATASRLNDSSYCFLVGFSAFIVHLVWVVYSLNEVSGMIRPLHLDFLVHLEKLLAPFLVAEVLDQVVHVLVVEFACHQRQIRWGLR